MKKDTDSNHFGSRRVEDAIRTSDIAQRAKAASPIAGNAGNIGRDNLGNRGDVSAINSGRDRL